MRIMVFGASGFLGAHVYQRLITRSTDGTNVIGTCRMQAHATGLIPIDLESDVIVRSLVQEVEPHAMIWCVKARQNADEAKLLGGLTSLLEEAGSVTRIIFVSSDAVLPGRMGRYSEEVTPALSVGTSSSLARYINAKIEAEMRISESCSDFCIVRTGPIFGQNVGGEWDTRTDGILSALERGEVLRRPVNLVRTYSQVEDLADGLCELVFSNVQGVLHVGAKTSVSHYDFALAIAQRFGYATDRITAFEIPPEDAARRHLRLDTTLDTCRATQCLTTGFRDVYEALAHESRGLIR